MTLVSLLSALCFSQNCGIKAPCLPVLAAHNGDYHFRALIDVDERFWKFIAEVVYRCSRSSLLWYFVKLSGIMQVYTSCSQNFGMTPCCALSPHFLAFTSFHTSIQRLMLKCPSSTSTGYPQERHSIPALFKCYVLQMYWPLLHNGFAV